MEKFLRIVGLTFGAAFLMSLFGCDAIFKDENENSREPARRVAHQESAPNIDAAPEEAITDKDTQCDPNQKNQCALIPREGCFGCMEEEGKSIAVNMTTAKKIMMARKNECMEKAKTFKPSKDKMSKDESCQYNKAECSAEGRCVLGKMTPEEEAEKKKQIEQIMKRMRERQKQNGGGAAPAAFTDESSIE